jgi:hypothetical protein
VKRLSICSLLIFLVISAFADDAWAAATPDPSDDILAAQNNLYLHVTPTLRCTGRFTKAWPALHAELHAGAALPPESGLEFCFGLLSDDSAGVRRLIYLFMTLRR